jgi:GNAT superfamily N-acetyltransferase
MHKEFTKDDFLISTDKQKLDFAVIHGFLSRESYWALNIPEDVVRRSIEGSLCFGVYHRGTQVGFARLITDCATMAYVADVFIVREYRGRGLSKWLMQCVTSLPELAVLRRWVLVTRDAHSLYEGVGFTPLREPEGYMERRRPNPYGTVS